MGIPVLGDFFIQMRHLVGRLPIVVYVGYGLEWDCLEDSVMDAGVCGLVLMLIVGFLALALQYGV